MGLKWGLITKCAFTNSCNKPTGKAPRKPSPTTDLSQLADALIANSGNGIYIVQEGKFVFVSPLYQQLTGYSENELIGTDSLDNVHPDDRDRVRQEAISCLKAPHREPYEYRFITKQKEILCELLDKNQLYVNLSSLGDADFACTEEEKKVTKDFYQIKK